MISTYSYFGMAGALKTLQKLEKQQKLSPQVISLAAEFIGNMNGDHGTNVFIDTLFSPLKSKEIKMVILLAKMNDDISTGQMAEVRFHLPETVVDQTESDFYLADGKEAESTLIWGNKITMLGKSPFRPNIATEILNNINSRNKV